MYFYSEQNGNMTYSIDMLRLKTYISYSTFTELEFRIKVGWKKYLKSDYTSARINEFFYNFNIEDDKGNSFWFGFLHNTEKRELEKEDGYNLTIEFNPNKLKDNEILKYILGISGEWYIKRYDLAIDVKVNILDLIVDKKLKRKMKIFSNGYDDLTYEIGKGDGRLKIYNKKIESKLNIAGDLTRIEITRELEDLPIVKVKYFKYDGNFPDIYLNQYVMSLSDYKEDKTLLALSYAVQHGYPLDNLSRVYKKKIKDMFEGGYAIRFYNKYVEYVLQQTIYRYFVRNDLVHWDRG